MTERVIFLRQQAVEFRKLARAGASNDGLRRQFVELAERCEQIAADIERLIGGASPPP